jgi:hypothetical protein
MISIDPPCSLCCCPRWSGWASPTGIAAGLAAEVCSILLELQSRHPLVSPAIVVLCTTQLVRYPPTAPAPAWSLLETTTQALDLCPSMPHTILASIVERCRVRLSR